MPTPGNLSHLGYLATMELPDSKDFDLEQFFAETQAIKSLGIIIKQQRTYRPIQSPYIDFDSRLYGTGDLCDWLTGSIYKNPNNPDQSHITISRKSNDQPVYGAFIPITPGLAYDPSRNSEAVINYNFGGTKQRAVFNQSAQADEYPEEKDPRILAYVLHRATHDLAYFLGYSPNELVIPKPELIELKSYSMHPDYLADNPVADDPDEFIPRPKQW